MKRVGLLGGTFDPFHFGHLNLAIEMLEKCPLDEIWFCPAGGNPFKEKPLVLGSQRAEMVKAAIDAFPSFRLIEIELGRKGPTYTFDTLQTLMAQHQEIELSLVLGEDALATLPRWHRIEELIQMVPLLIGSRQGELKELDYGSSSLKEAVARGMTKTRCLEISATEVRQRLVRGLTCAHLVPKETLDYIKTHHLYSVKL